MILFSACRRTKTLLWNYAKGCATSGEKSQVEAHLAVCNSCRRELAGYQSAAQLLSGYRAADAPASRLGWRDVQLRVERAQAVSRPAGPRWTKIGVAGFALAGATAVVMVFMNNVSQPPAPVFAKTPGAHSNLRSGQDLAKAAGSEGSMSIDDTNLKNQGIQDLNTGVVAVAPVLKSAAPGARLRVRPSSQRARLTSPGDQAPRQIALADENVDGGSPRQLLRPEYVIAPASSGNDEDQNRRYPIDVISSHTVASSEGSEELHPL